MAQTWSRSEGFRKTTKMCTNIEAVIGFSNSETVRCQRKTLLAITVLV